tara:strand:+ start:292 stop:978 length:687 start_codon:yes stop_codon:yes gene_type:complete
MLGLGNSIIHGGAPEEFLPTQISNLKLWLQNDVGVTAAQWDDSSGNSNHAEQTNSGFQATVSDGGLEFDASDDHYDIPDIVIDDREALIVFVVLELDNVGNDTILGLDATTGFIQVQSRKTIRVKIDGTTTSTTFGTDQVLDDTKLVLVIQREEGATGNINVFKNGSLLTPNTQRADSGPITFKTIGSRNSDHYLDGHVLELLVYDTADLTADEISNVNNYLTSKFGL